MSAMLVAHRMGRPLQRCGRPGRGVLALVDISGAGKPAIADRFVRSLLGVTKSELHLQQDTTLGVAAEIAALQHALEARTEH